MRKFMFLLFACLSSAYAFGQQREVTGTVKNEEGMPLAGASVWLMESRTGVSTGVDGTFTLSISQKEEQTLMVDLIGYKSKSIPIKATSSVIDVVLLADEATELEEVVAVGYGSVRKKDLTGSVGSVGGKELQERGTTSAMEALQGAVPGVDISSTSTRPGKTFNILIRGQNSIQGGSPLYIVDGIATGNIDFLNPADIESIDVLKDASSTAIYGSRGSNGVVIVTTKNAGKPGDTRTTVTYDGYYGVRRLARIPNFMDGREWVDFRTSAYYTYANNRYDLGTPNSILQNSPLLESRLYNQQYEDWLDLGTKSGRQQNHYLGVAGASDKLTYNLGVGYQQEVGNFLKEDLNRYTLKLSVEHKTSDYLTTGASINFVHGVNNSGSQHGYRDILRMPPILYAYDSNGNLIAQPGIAASIEGIGNFTSSPNPLNEITSGTEETRQYDLLSNIFIELRPMENLSFRSTFMPRFNRTRIGQYYGVVPGTRNQDMSYQNNLESLEWTWDNIINYNTLFADDHKLDVSLIQSAYKTRLEGIRAGANDLPYPSAWYNLFSGSFAPNQSATSYSETSLLSFAARANYEFKGRYLLTGTVRYDGSAKLRDKWAAFPSVAAAWRMSDESFMEDVSFVDDLKLRASFGYSGNNNGIEPFGSQLTPRTGSIVWYDFNGVPATGFMSGPPINQAITWEKTRELNLGVDFSILNNRLRGNVEFYDKLSDGLLMQRTLTIESGVPYMMDNIGSVNNRGIEFGLHSTNIRSSDWEWTTSFMFSHNKNKIRSLYGRKEDVIAEARFIGKPVEVIYDYRITGLWRMDQLDEAAKLGQQPGQAIAADTDGNGTITSADRVILGSPYPDWIGSITSNLRYRNWDLSVNLYTRQGVFVNDRFLEEFGPQNSQRGRPKINYDYYVPPGLPRYDWNSWDTYPDGSPKAVWGDSGAGNENAKYPHPQNVGPYYGNNGRYTDASFVKIRNIVLGYTLPRDIVGKWKMSSMRIYANILNPFVFTKYKGWDPEYATTGLSEGNGPSNVTYQLGVNVRF